MCISWSLCARIFIALHLIFVQCSYALGNQVTVQALFKVLALFR